MPFAEFVQSNFLQDLVSSYFRVRFIVSSFFSGTCRQKQWRKLCFVSCA